MSKLAHVKLTEISLWEDNPRTGSVNNENEEIFALIRKQQTKTANKLTYLAKSIYNNGIYEPIGILKYFEGSMVVKEGNRRITCLKLLKNPEIIREDFPELYRHFKELKKDVNEKIFSNIPARIFNEDENEELEKWIELRHNGLQEGKGLDKWGPYEKENWNSYRGRNSPLLNFHEYLVSQNILSEEEVNSVSKTNWDRILGTIGRSYLGISLEDKKYIVKISPIEFKKRIIKTVQGLSGKSVGTVYDNESIDKFFKELNFEEKELSSCELQKGQTSANEDNLSNNQDPNGPQSDIETELIHDDTNHDYESVDEDKEETQTETDEPETEENQNSEDESSNAGTKKAHRQSKPAPFLCNITCYLQSTQDTDGIIRLASELKRMSKSKSYRDYPIAAAVLMRNLLEQCLVYYLKKRNKWSKFYNTKRNDPTLTEIIEKYRSDTDIFAQDRRLERLMHILIDSPGLKELLNMIVHHPYQFAATPDLLDSIAHNGYLALVQYIINFNQATNTVL